MIKILELLMDVAEMWSVTNILDIGYIGCVPWYHYEVVVEKPLHD